MDVVLSAGQLGDLAVSPLQVSDLVGQTLQVALGVVERRPLVGGDQLGHLLLHPLDGAHHVGKHLLAFLQRPVRPSSAQEKQGGMQDINWGVHTGFSSTHVR